jgi:hypothetical protein
MMREVSLLCSKEHAFGPCRGQFQSTPVHISPPNSLRFLYLPVSSKWSYLFREFRPRKESLRKICKYTWYIRNNLNKMATSPEVHHLQFLFHLSDITLSSAFRTRTDIHASCGRTQDPSFDKYVCIACNFPSFIQNSGTKFSCLLFLVPDRNVTHNCILVRAPYWLVRVQLCAFKDIPLLCVA